jgi:hypothetical protein
MAHSTEIYWISELRPSSGILNTRKQAFRKLDLLPCSGEGRKTRTLLGPLGRANFNH